MKESVRQAYKELHSYFGLRASDAYLNKAAGNSPPPSDGLPDSPLGEVYHTLYGDENYNPDITEICKKIDAIGLDTSKKLVCITPYLGNKNDSKLSGGNLPLNSSEITLYKDQGLTGAEGGRKNPSSKLYNIKELSNIFSEQGNRIDVVQVFPVRGCPDVSDTDVLTLFMSTINSVNMSLAVPYVDILVTTQGKDDTNISAQPFSFGSFLGAGKDTALNAKFSDQSISGYGASTKKSQASKGEDDVKLMTQAVASMEIFTSPQTLVNATPDNIRYNENSDAGRHVDIFRPFLSIESLNLSVVPAGAGLISFKTASMKLKLFDRGRLSQIAPIVAPSRFGLVKFDIEYGWSHPGGRTKVGRSSDANDDRIGQLIDSMRVTESYQVVNSNFSFEQDGSVSIDLKLSMLGRKAMSDRSIKLSENDADSVEIEYLLREIQSSLSNAPKNVNIPSVITGGVDTFINMQGDDLKKLKAFAGTLVSGKAGSAAKKAGNVLVSLIGKPNNKKLTDKEKLGKFQTNRKNQVAALIKNLRSKDDPFIRTEKGSNSDKGITKSDLTGPKNVKYASLGTIMMNVIGPALQEVGDVIFVFSCFNKNAGAMFDHNIAQFPIQIQTDNKNDVTLENLLLKEFQKRSKITPEDFMSLLNQNFLLREDSRAYGLVDIYEKGPVFDEDKQIKEKRKKDYQADADKPEIELKFEEAKINNLSDIYGPKRNHPTFTLPRITMKIDVKPSASGKNIIRVIVFDQVATGIGDMQEIFTDVTSYGYFEKDEYASSDNKVRGAAHGEVSEIVFSKLQESSLIEKYTADPSQSDKSTLLEQLEALASEDFKTPTVKFESQGSERRKELEKKLDRIYFVRKFAASDTKLRNIFYKFFPTLIYGSMGSGILSAQLGSNQNDALTTIALQRQDSDKEIPPGLPMVIHPTQLSMEVIGTPMFKYSQKFFVDFGTGTSADNFYVVTGVDMSFGPGEFKTSLKMTQLDVFGRFMKTRDTIMKTLISSYQNDRVKK